MFESLNFQVETLIRCAALDWMDASEDGRYYTRVIGCGGAWNELRMRMKRKVKRKRKGNSPFRDRYWKVRGHLL
jgi:hypothetical protein